MLRFRVSNKTENIQEQNKCKEWTKWWNVGVFRFEGKEQQLKVGERPDPLIHTVVADRLSLERLLDSSGHFRLKGLLNPDPGANTEFSVSVGKTNLNLKPKLELKFTQLCQLCVEVLRVGLGSEWILRKKGGGGGDQTPPPPHDHML